MRDFLANVEREAGPGTDGGPSARQWLRDWDILAVRRESFACASRSWATPKRTGCVPVTGFEVRLLELARRLSL